LESSLVSIRRDHRRIAVDLQPGVLGLMGLLLISVLPTTLASGCGHGREPLNAIAVSMGEVPLGEVATIACVRERKGDWTFLYPRVTSRTCGTTGPIHLKIDSQKQGSLYDTHNAWLEPLMILLPEGIETPLGEVAVRLLTNGDEVVSQISATCDDAAKTPVTGFGRCRIQ
jgi:hypothetical protein